MIERLCLFAMLSSCATAAPVISSVVNAASNIGQGQPNGGIAQGAIFVAYGTGLGPGAIAVSATPFQSAAAGGASVRITVNGRTVDAPMYYASATQVAGLVPSATPVGSGTFTVTFNGESSAPAPIKVVQSNFGVFAVSQAGTGEAILTYADFSLVSGSKAANPGETVILWGTGLGPVSGNETAGPLPGDMTSIPVKVWVGAVPASLVYRGRSGCCIGEDQIVFTIPSGIAGCNVPLAVQIGDQVSNMTTLAIASTGRVCTAETSGLPPTLAGKATVVIGGVGVSRLFLVPADPLFGGEGGAGVFSRVGPAAALGTISLAPPISFDTCATQGAGPSSTVSGILPVYLDAGPSLTLNGPNGTRSLPKLTPPLIYSGSLGTSTSPGYLVPGHYTISGSGGRDIGAFTASLDVPSPLFALTNDPASLTTIDRSKGLTITWTGGGPASIVAISGTVSLVRPDRSVVAGSFACYTHAGAGQFTVPPYILLTLPTSDAVPGVKAQTGLTIFNTVAGSFTAPGLDAGEISSSIQYSSLPVFK